MKRTLIPSIITTLIVMLPLTAFAQSAPKAAAPAETDKVAELEAAQAALEKQLSEMQAKVDASAENEETKKAIADLSRQVEDLDRKIQAQAAETKETDAAMQAQIDAMAPTSGYLIKGPGESYLKLGGLLQVRVETTKDGAPNGENWDYDTYLRRMRLMFYGQLNKWVNFFIETDNPNFGKNGTWSGLNTFIQDAYLELNLHEAFQIDMGMLLLPFSHQGMQGATSLLAMDYHSGLIKYPSGGHHVWRDAGVMFRGLLAKQHIEYRFGVFNGTHGGGMDPRNPKDLPRLTGRLTFNVFDAEGGAGAGGMFYDGIYLKQTDAGIVSTKRVLSFGTSVDWQADLNVEIEAPALRAETTDPYTVVNRKDYVAAAWDVFWDIPLGARKLMSLNGQANVYLYNHGDRSSDVTTVLDPTTNTPFDMPSRFAYYNVVGDGASYTGVGMSSELGFRYSWFQPLVLVDFFKSTKADQPAESSVTDMAAYCGLLGVDGCGANMGDLLAVHGGVNFYPFGHATTFKLEAGTANRNGSDKWVPSVKLQAQLLF